MFKKIIFFMFLITIFAFSASAQDKLIRVPYYSSENLEELGEFSITDVRDGYVKLKVTNEHLDVLRNLGYSPEILIDDLREHTLNQRKTPQGDRFTSYDAMVADMQQVAQNYPDITELHTYGYSVQGREILVMKISDNVSQNETEPEVRMLGCHHGDEQMSAEIPLELIHYLTENYDSDPFITSLVDEREIWIGPMVNPDGHELGTRYNANNVDLNRNYGFMWNDGWATGGYAYSEPEVRAMRLMGVEHNFVLSLSFHCSGDVINYVWNYTYNPTPDDSLIEYLSEGYEEVTDNNYWVVQGAYWYITYGDTNDWSYGTRTDIDWTIEMDNYNFDNVWELNRDGILYIIDQAGMGVHGVVTDAETGSPIAAHINVLEVGMPIYADPENGDYHRPLLPGTYTLEVSANGYQSEIVSDVVVTEGNPPTVDVELMPTDSMNFAYNIVSVKTNSPDDEIINLPVEALGATDGIPAPLGKNGWIVLDMGEGTEIYNDPGNDFAVVEAELEDGAEGYSVYVNNNYLNDGSWTYIGDGNGTTEFNLDGSGYEIVRYVKIVDDNDGGYYGEYAGLDLDAVHNISLPTLVEEVSEFIDVWGTEDSKYDLNDDGVIDTEDIQILISKGVYGILRPNFPNPFNPSTNITYSVLKKNNVELKIYNIQGNLVKTLVSDHQDAGRYSVRWDGTDETGISVGSGIYLYELSVGTDQQIRRMTLVK